MCIPSQYMNCGRCKIVMGYRLLHCVEIWARKSGKCLPV
uniref:Uncharacterized protein n=1 Tax=Anguilla anguilla TaxID=7936 RepID=A0A0E9WA02_ANGAN